MCGQGCQAEGSLVGVGGEEEKVGRVGWIRIVIGYAGNCGLEQVEGESFGLALVGEDDDKGVVR